MKHRFSVFAKIILVFMLLLTACLFTACDTDAPPADGGVVEGGAGNGGTDNGGGDGNSHTHTYAEEWSSDTTHHWHAATCGHEDEQKDKTTHIINSNDQCTVCEYTMPYYTKGLTYSKNGNAYTVTGIGSATDTDIVIPAYHEELPVVGIKHGAFNDCSHLTSVEIPAGVTDIGARAFDHCTGLASITIPAGVTSIGPQAFYNCTGLTSITIPSSVTSIGPYAFSGCTQLIQEQNGISYVDKWVIDCSDNVTEVALRSDTVGIGGLAFYNCTGLTNITIPESVTSIGDYAFRGCRGLTDIHFSGTVAQWNEISKGYGWKYNTGEFRVYCTDGTISWADA